MNYIIDCEKYDLIKKKLVLEAFKRLGLSPVIHGDTYDDYTDINLQTVWCITHIYDTSSPVCYNFNQLMFDSGLPFKEDGIGSYCVIEPEALLSGDMVHKSIKNFTISPYAITDEELKNLIKGV